MENLTWINLKVLVTEKNYFLPEWVQLEGIIYICENKINNKKYIGQSKKSLIKRWKQHYIRFNKKTHNLLLYNAFSKYGLENFEVAILKFGIFSKKELNTLEKEYIKSYNAYALEDGWGYNMTEGGHSTNKQSLEKGMQTTLKKYGGIGFAVPKNMKIAQDALKQKYGKNLPFNRPEIKKKVHESVLKKYGMYLMHTEENKKKAQKALKDKYGSVLPFNTPEAIKKAQKSAPVGRLYANIIRHINNLKEKGLEINTYNYIHLSGNSHRMWQQHIPNVLNRLEELRKRNEWTLELDSIFNCIEYDSSKCGIQKIKIYNKKIN